MNKYLRALVVIPTGFLKTLCLKVFHPKSFKGVHFAQISPHTEITLEKGGKLIIGKGLKMRDWAKIRVRKGAQLLIGNNVSINSNNILACRENITIGDNVEFSPGVQIYDHDHDFKANGGIKAKLYKKSSIIIGNNVWIGANAIILRGSNIGDNTVIAAGSVVKDIVPSNSVFLQKKENTIKKF